MGAIMWSIGGKVDVFVPAFIFEWAARRDQDMATKLGSISAAELHRELQRRERGVVTIRRRRERLLAKVKELDAQLRATGVAVGGGNKRPKNEVPLADALASVLARRTMSVTEVCQAVQEAGYRTTSPNFRTIVNQTVIKDKRFKRVGRGLYTARKGKADSPAE